VQQGRRWRAETTEIARELAREWHDDRIGGLAAEVAFFGVLSLFPTLLLLTGALGWLEAIAGEGLAADAEAEVVGFLRRVLSDDAGTTIDAVQRLFEGGDLGAFAIGVLGAVWAASRGFSAIINALDVAYDLDERRPWMRQRLTAVGLAAGTALVGAVLLAMLVLGPLLGSGQDVADAVGAGGVFAAFWDWLRWPVVAALATVWAATVFHLAPNHRTPWRWDLPGAALTAGLWALLSLGFRLYLTVAAGANQVLGTLGGSLIVLLWLYVMSLALLLGGELNAVLVQRHRVPQNPR
jgi:membrane protein